MARFSNETVPAISHAAGPGQNPGQPGDAPLSENAKPGPMGNTKMLARMHSKALNARQAHANRLHKAGNK